MKVLIIACGETGVTLKAAKKIKEALNDDVDVVDGKEVTTLANYDAYVLGTNVRFSKLNKRFIKLAKEAEKLGCDVKRYVYVCGAEIEKKDDMKAAAKKAAPWADEVFYVWGELHTDGLRFFKKYAVESFIQGRKKDGLPSPRILDKEIRALARRIKDDYAERN